MMILVSTQEDEENNLLYCDSASVLVEDCHERS